MASTPDETPEEKAARHALNQPLIDLIAAEHQQNRARRSVAAAQRNSHTMAEVIIDDAIDRWHDNKALPAPLTSQPLHAYLGVTWEPTKAWLEGTDKPAEVRKPHSYLKIAQKEINRLLEERAKIWEEGRLVGIRASSFSPPGTVSQINPYEENPDA